MRDSRDPTNESGPNSESQMKVREDEIDLMEYWHVIWKRRKMILSVTFAAALASIVLSMLLTPVYRAEVLLAPVGDEGSKGQGVSLGSLGGLASIAGISLSGGGNVEENLAVLKSREFISKFITVNKLIPVLIDEAANQEASKTQWDAYRLFSRQVMAVRADKKTGLITISVDWKDPVLAATWANDLVSRLNAHLRQQAIAQSKGNLQYLNKELTLTHVSDMRQTLFELILREQKKAMLANTQEQFAFRVLDAAVPPDEKIKPNKRQIVIVGVFLAGFISMIAAFVLEKTSRSRQKHS